MKRAKDLSAGSDRAELELQLETLRSEVRRLQLEQELLKKANELLKNDPASFPRTPSHAAKRLRSLSTGARYPMAVCMRTRL